MSQILIGARVEPMDVSRAARRAGFLGTDSRASVVRYSLLRLAGYTHDDAMARATYQPLNVDSGMIIRGGKVNAKIDPEILREAEAAKPAEIKDRASMIRYALHIAAEYSHDEAMDEARRTIGRPKKITADT